MAHTSPKAKRGRQKDCNGPRREGKGVTQKTRRDKSGTKGIKGGHRDIRRSLRHVFPALLGPGGKGEMRYSNEAGSLLEI